jgi:putative DNA methylase
MTKIHKKKLIEVALPLEYINPEALRQKKKAPKGYPTSIHKWWAQRPLATCRAVLFAQFVDDPTAWPEKFPTEESQRRERERLHKIIEAMVPWNTLDNDHAMAAARWEIARSVAWGNGEEPPAKSDPRAVIQYLQENAPPVYDPFSGGGSIPLEAQRLGLRAFGSDLNPVAVLVSKALIEIPPKFVDRKPVNPHRDNNRAWKKARGLACDIRYYGEWMWAEAEKRIGDLYPKVDLGDGTKAPVIAWLWARTVASPDPMARGAHVPLVSSFVLSTGKENKVWVEVIRDQSASGGWRFDVKTGPLTAENQKKLGEGTKTGRGSYFVCSLTGSPIESSYIKSEGMAGRLGTRLMAVVAETGGKRIYVSPDIDQEKIANIEKPSSLELAQEMPDNPRWFSPPDYGFLTYKDLFTARQLVALEAFADLITEARDIAERDARASGLDEGKRLHEGGDGAVAYADAIATYLAFVVDRMAAYGSTQSTWLPKDNAIRSAFNRQAIQMVWDFAEPNVFTKSSGAIGTCINVVAACIDAASCIAPGHVTNSNAANGNLAIPTNIVISTDPPYYDNVGYADLSDYFYVLLRRSLSGVWPELFRRVLSPKDEELVATPYRHNGQDNAEAFFLNGMRKALGNIIRIANSDMPVTIYYAFKQSEAAEEGLTSPGWATFLQAVFDAGFAVDGTWPVRSEGEVRMNSNAANALASSIVLVCRKRLPTAAVATRREFVARLKREMPDALAKIKEAGVGPVDMAQSALGPGMGIYTGYAKVLEPDDSEMTVRTAIALINEAREEILGEEDAHYDPETRFCVDWFQAFGVSDGKSGDAIGMANAYSLGLADLEQAGVFYARGGVARLLKRSELPTNWNPANDKRLTHWECAQHLIRILEAKDGSEATAARLVAAMNPEDAQAARTLAYRLYDICEKKGWAQEAQVYNLLAEEFPHLEEAALEFEGERGPAQAVFDL